jgi:MscS family membrane protein
MKRTLIVSGALLLCVLFTAPAVSAQPAPAPTTQAEADGATSSATVVDDAAAATNTKAAAVVATQKPTGPRQPDFLEHLVDEALVLFNVRESGNTWTHYTIAILLLVGSFLLRHIVTNFIFAILKRFAARTTTTLDDKLFPALEQPVATFITIAGLFASVSVLKLSTASDTYLGYGSTIAFSLVVFWGLLRAFGAVLDHAQEVALRRQMGVAAFMPWIKKTLITIFVVFGVLMVVQSLGFDVKALLAGLGIGGLAFALAAQDTLANVFGSIVVAIDQPFKIGEFVQIAGNSGTVEDIGLRSTKLRRVDKALIVVPNKTVAAEVIQNLSRFSGRRSEQILGLTYDAKPEQIEALVTEVRRLILAEPKIDPASLQVYFRDFSSSSLDIWVAFNTTDPDFGNFMALRQRLNIAFMKAVEARGLSMAYPTQTIQFDGPIARRLAERAVPPPAA